MANTSDVIETNKVRECIETENDEHFLAATKLVQLGMVPKVLKAAVELNIFGVIAKAGPKMQLSPKEIAAQLPACLNPEAPAMLDRMLRLLASHSVVSCSLDVAVDGNVERKYGLGPVSKFFVPDEYGISLAPFISLIEDPLVLSSWSKFNEAVSEGGNAFNKVHGVDVFEYANLDPKFNKLFNEAMFNYTTISTNKMLKKYKGFVGIERLVDVGGGLGHTLCAITSMYPSIKGINYDLPHVVFQAQSYLGVEHVGGDMFKSIPESDVILMKWILHDWSDESCVTLLKNCYNALPDDGKVIVMESVVIEEPETTTIAKIVSQMDVCMMEQTPGGKERSEREYLALANNAGFARIQLVCSVYQFWVMEFHK